MHAIFEYEKDRTGTNVIKHLLIDHKAHWWRAMMPPPADGSTASAMAVSGEPSAHDRDGGQHHHVALVGEAQQVCLWPSLLPTRVGHIEFCTLDAPQ